MRRTIPLACAAVAVTAVLTCARGARAIETCQSGQYCCTATYYTPAHYNDVAAGDVVLQYVTSYSALAPVMKAIGEKYTHALMITDNGGVTRSDTILDMKAVGEDDINCRLDEGNLRAAPPGIRYAVNLDQTYLPNTGQPGSGSDLAGTKAITEDANGSDLVLVGAGNPSAQSSTGYERYHVHAFVTQIANAQCSQLVHDSFSSVLRGAPGLGYSATQVLAGANGLYEEVENICLGSIDSEWSYAFGDFVCGSKTQFCINVANQVVNEMLFDCDSCVSQQWNASNVPTIPGGASGPNSPWSLGKYWEALGKSTRLATVTDGYFTTVHDALCP